MDSPHYPVMLKQVLELCDPKNGGQFVDCTFGSGGYSNAILSFPKTKVIAFDRDPEIIKYVKETKKKFNKRFSFYNDKFSNIDKLTKKGFKANFVIFDLGLSMLQILNLKRGFSFKSKSNLDMRMGINSISAKEVLNNFKEDTLRDIFKLFGEDKDSSKISKNIIRERKKSPILSVPKLVEIISMSKRKNYKKKINICTQAFQALRIFVNQEISELIEGLIKATQILENKGKIIIISFHSIEDRIIKYYFNNYSKNKSNVSRYQPIKNSEEYLFQNYKNKIITPGADEIIRNNPSRSAKLRYAIRSEKIFFYPHDLKNKFKRYLDLEKQSA